MYKDATSGVAERIAKWQHRFSDFEVQAGAPLAPIQKQCMFEDSFVDDSNENTKRSFDDCQLVIGMHPDEATDPIVEISLRRNKPFAIVPCCVYWRLFPHRRTRDGEQVRSVEQLGEYLVDLAPKGKIRKAELDFPGRNTVLYTLPDHLETI